MSKVITIDPVTRIEGHLRVDCEITGGHIRNAWASGTAFRGLEIVLKGRDPRDAWIFTQRICGVCTTVFAMTSVRAVENALKMEIPLNAQFIRNLIISAHSVHSHIVHFYHLASLDWVDIPSALNADPSKTARLAARISNWHLNSRQHFKEVQDRFRVFVDTGQLGVFAGDGHWGHPEMKLRPEENLLFVAHYLQALDYQRKINMVVAILGGKTPHIQNLAVGGVANPIYLDSQSSLNMERLFKIKSIIDEVGDFVKEVYFVDACAISAFHADWFKYGAGVTNYLSVPELPLDTKGMVFELPGGYIENGDLATFRPIRDPFDEFFIDGIKETVKHSWYKMDKTLHPWEGETDPHYTEFMVDEKYSWSKAPTFHGKPVQVGPLANVLAMYAAGHTATKKYTDSALATISNIAGINVPLNALHSTLGRHVAKAVRCVVRYETLQSQWELLVDNIGKGDRDSFNPPEFPAGEIRGVGFHEAPRGVLSHWPVIDGGKIKNFQIVVPSTFNMAPRNEKGELGPCEASLIGTPVVDSNTPLEALRTIRSFDPCMACAIHVVDLNKK